MDMMSREQKMKENPISRNIVENEEFLKLRLGIGVSFDVGVRKLSILDTEIQLYFINGFCDSEYIIELVKELMSLDTSHKKADRTKTFDLIHNHLANVQVEITSSLDEAITSMLTGLIFILVEGYDKAFIIDVRSYPGRQPEEPDTERVVRGARDGYVENLVFNTALTRRRIHDERLRNEIFQVGLRSRTDVCVSYIDGIADPDLVNIIKEEIKAIDIDGIPMADKVIEEYVLKQGMNPFPLVRYTERPDVAAFHLLEGHVLIMVDTSPSVMITPATLFHHMQHAEEYRQAPLVGTFLRWTRFLGIFFSLFLLPFWLLVVNQPSLLPSSLEFIGPEKVKHVPVVAQILFAEFGIELLRMAAIHTPSPLATALGLVAALLIGDIAIQVGYFTPEVVLYVALGVIGIFATPSHELGLALRISRIALIIAVALFKVPGFVVGGTLFILLLASVKTFNKPYMAPFLPLNPQGAWQILVRTAVPSVRFRPSIVHPKDPVKQRSE